MSGTSIDHDQNGNPVGPIVENWTPRPRPPRTPMIGRTCDVVPLTIAHAADLHAANITDLTGNMWAYLTSGPYASLADYEKWVAASEASEDPLFHAVIDKATGKAVGSCSYLRIDPPGGVIEVGWIAWSPLLQKTVMATEAMYLMMRRVFDELGYRRYEWKCNALNAPSMRAAERFGFTYEGTFRQAAINRGRNRDTAWFSILDSEWPDRKARFERWLDPANFDEKGRQKVKLGG
ncbi:GNAT family N-acetyltransferase [Oryzibacter oryziterrae]|uniref:GNAT family N-acetyltransferase n=1 Tax=Oryzibacter oryziterrae TaxID=2766474 RepID=UPI001F1D39B1|nr:GNAT family protein [Oryzibacter oryziterrae]